MVSAWGGQENNLLMKMMIHFWERPQWWKNSLNDESIIIKLNTGCGWSWYWGKGKFLTCVYIFVRVWLPVEPSPALENCHQSIVLAPQLSSLCHCRHYQPRKICLRCLHMQSQLSDQPVQLQSADALNTHSSRRYPKTVLKLHNIKNVSCSWLPIFDCNATMAAAASVTACVLCRHHQLRKLFGWII
jgi:hypothetical protein